MRQFDTSSYNIYHDDRKEGTRYGRWVTTGTCAREKSGPLYLECVCDCGNHKFVREYTLKSKESTSCGCYASEYTVKRQKVHGESSSCRHDASPLYRIWCGMIYRCTSSCSRDAKRYYARGIHVCDDWLHSFAVFKNWALSNGYGKGLSIDRIDNNGPYSPENCRWVTMKTQANNRCTNRYIDAFGEKRTITEWAHLYDIHPSTVSKRLKKGWDVESALTNPPHKGVRYVCTSKSLV